LCMLCNVFIMKNKFLYVCFTFSNNFNMIKSNNNKDCLHKDKKK
jgi:hypothetical protein